MHRTYSKCWSLTPILVLVTNEKVAKTKTNFLTQVIEGTYQNSDLFGRSSSILFSLSFSKIYFSYYQNYYCWVQYLPNLHLQPKYRLLYNLIVSCNNCFQFFKSFNQKVECLFLTWQIDFQTAWLYFLFLKAQKILFSYQTYTSSNNKYLFYKCWQVTGAQP